MILILILFFIPGIITFFDFLYFSFTGFKWFNRLFGGILDILNIVAFPLLYILIIGADEHSLAHEEITYPLILLLIASSVIAYFLIQHFASYFSYFIKTALLILLGFGVIINIAMLFTYDGLLIPGLFNLPIILLYLMQIIQNINQKQFTTH